MGPCDSNIGGMYDDHDWPSCFNINTRERLPKNTATFLQYVKLCECMDGCIIESFNFFILLWQTYQNKTKHLNWYRENNKQSVSEYTLTLPLRGLISLIAFLTRRSNLLASPWLLKITPCFCCSVRQWWKAPWPFEYTVFCDNLWLKSCSCNAMIKF